MITPDHVVEISITEDGFTLDSVSESVHLVVRDFTWEEIDEVRHTSPVGKVSMETEIIDEGL